MHSPDDEEESVCVCVILLFSVQLVARGVPYTTTLYRACLVFVHTDYKQNLIGGHPKAKKKWEKERENLDGLPRKVGRKWPGYEA